jgi:antitoxin ParD1/3/4
MPTRNVNLTDELDRFVLKKVKSGRYENASEVVRAALRNLEREEQQYEAKLAALRTAIDEGDASGVAKGESLHASARPSTFPRRRVSPWPRFVSLAGPKPTCSASPLIPFVLGAKTRPSVTSTILRCVAGCSPIIQRWAG